MTAPASLKTTAVFLAAILVHAVGNAVFYSCGPSGVISAGVACSAAASHYYVFFVFPLGGFMVGSSSPGKYRRKAVVLGLLFALISGAAKLVAQQNDVRVDVVGLDGALLLVGLNSIFAIPLCLLGAALGSYLKHAQKAG